MFNKKLLIKVYHILKDDFLFVFEGFAVLILLVESVKSFSNHYSDEVSYLCPYVAVDLSSCCDSFHDLVLYIELHP